MRFKLYECHISRPEGLVSGYIVATCEAHAERVAKEREQALGITPHSIKLFRVDETLPDEMRDGLDEMLEGAPVGFVSRCDFGWVAHFAPVHRMRLYRSHDHRGEEVLAVAPNAEVAVMLFETSLRPYTTRQHVFRVTDVTDALDPKQCSGLEPFLISAEIGIAVFDEATGRWSIA